MIELQDFSWCRLKDALLLPALLLLVLAGAFGLGWLKGTRAGASVATVAKTKADEAKGRADAERTRAEGFDQAAKKATAAKLAADDKAARLAGEVARLRGAILRVDPDPPEGNAPVGPFPESGLAEVVAKQDELIQAQRGQIQARDEEIKGLVIARDAWRDAHREREQEALQLRAALKAQEGIAAANLWRGRVQGFAVGISIGLAGGRSRW